jgi:hypothetical protein
LQFTTTKLLREAGDNTLPYRLWIAHDVGVMDFVYLNTPAEAAQMMKDGIGDGEFAIGFEERNTDDDAEETPWICYYSIDGDDLEDEFNLRGN